MDGSSLSGRLRVLRQSFTPSRSSVPSKVARGDSDADPHSAPAPPPGPSSRRLTRIAKDRPILTAPGTALGDTTAKVQDNIVASLDEQQDGPLSNDCGLEAESTTAQEALESALADAMAPAPSLQRADSQESSQPAESHEVLPLSMDATNDQVDQLESTAPPDDEVDALVSRIAQLAGTVAPSDLASAEHLDCLSRHSAHWAGHDSKAEPPNSNLVSPNWAASPQPLHPPLKELECDLFHRSSPSLEPDEPFPSSPTLDLHLPSAPSEAPGAQDDSTLAQLASLEPVRADPGSSEALKNNIMARVAGKRRERRSRSHAEERPKSQSARIKSLVANAKTRRGDEEGRGGDQDSDELDPSNSSSSSELEESHSNASEDSQSDGSEPSDPLTSKLDALSSARVPSPPKRGPDCHQCQVHEGTLYCTGPGCNMVFCRSCWGQTHAMRSDWADHTTVDLSVDGS